MLNPAKLLLIFDLIWYCKASSFHSF